jgi:hypothetical protein
VLVVTTYNDVIRNEGGDCTVSFSHTKSVTDTACVLACVFFAPIPPVLCLSLVVSLVSLSLCLGLCVCLSLCPSSLYVSLVSTGAGVIFIGAVVAGYGKS